MGNFFTNFRATIGMFFNNQPVLQLGTRHDEFGFSSAVVWDRFTDNVETPKPLLFSPQT
jgi:hypothetical protein